VSTNDPRVFFAAERTLLAWIRTAIGLIGLGFVVARFGLFLQLLDRQLGAPTSHHASPWIGVGLALLGAATAAVSSWQHHRFRRTLGAADLPPGYRTGAALAIGFGVSIAGLVLAALLLF
jgi:putative membrane protein